MAGIVWEPHGYVWVAPETLRVWQHTSAVN